MTESNNISRHHHFILRLNVALATMVILNSPHDPSAPPTSRGAFLLLEGVDRCGKTTQSRLLVKRLLAAGVAATVMRFPDRTTATGQVINNYLTTAGNDLDDRAIHLLFSANRWEAVGQLTRHLRAGTTVVCDRYAYSGVAFSAAKVKEGDSEPLLPMEWCQAPDVGLPAPDRVIFLDLSQDEAEGRGGYVPCTDLGGISS
jgi:dTMP kinase